ncbi:hypothetical protein NDU88_006543 [Pleurodeles waltl]|uniref:Retrotransposon gag domain-containing protein n=1 Tax=Pleurodeles waltl TaxID=8319 RepID=A0AAV7QM23_PLEWA|nr:hypothetical protein NDU88_006543 [Pleurodeles waltl]
MGQTAGIRRVMEGDLVHLEDRLHALDNEQDRVPEALCRLLEVREEYAVVLEKLRCHDHVTVLAIEGESDGVEDECETAIKSLDARFKKCRNVTLERHKFYKRVQAEGESASSYVGDLRLLAVSCDYKEFEEEMIKDQLVEKTNNKKVQ